MRIGFFGGSFNPPTIAHIDLAKLAIEKCNLDKLYFVPVNDKYKKNGLISFSDRKEMLKIATKNESKIYVSDIEEKIEKQIYAIDIFEIIKEKYSDDEIYFIMGMDNFKKISSWKEYEKLKKYKYIVFERNESDESLEININDVKEAIFILSKNTNKISSSKVRRLIQENGNLSEFIDKDVEKYIINKNLYKNK